MPSNVRGRVRLSPRRGELFWSAARIAALDVLFENEAIQSGDSRRTPKRLCPLLLRSISMSTSTLSAARNWRRDTLPAGSWYARLPGRLLDALDGLIEHPPAVVTHVRLSPELHEL